ncbi:MAG: hypothetical protein ACFFDI_24350 [Promethearchaeota archaeon]
MKRFLKIKSSEWASDSNKEMLYEDENGELFKGPPINYTAGETIIAEISDGLIDGFYRIVQVIGKIPPKK